MGLLDFINSDEGRLGLGLLAAAGPRTAENSGLGQRMQDAFGAQDAYQNQGLQRNMMKQQIEGLGTTNQLHKAQTEKALKELEMQKYLDNLAGKYYKPAQSGINQSNIDSAIGVNTGMPNTPTTPASFDNAGYLREVWGKYPGAARQIEEAARKADQVKLGEGENIYSVSSKKPIFDIGGKQTDAMKNFEYARDKTGFAGGLQDYVAIAPNVTAQAIAALRDMQVGQIAGNTAYTLPPNIAPTSPKSYVVKTPDGQTFRFPDQAAANNFKRQAGIQ